MYIYDEQGQGDAPNLSKFIFDRSKQEENLSLLPGNERKEVQPDMADTEKRQVITV